MLRGAGLLPPLRSRAAVRLPADCLPAPHAVQLGLYSLQPFKGRQVSQAENRSGGRAGEYFEDSERERETGEISHRGAGRLLRAQVIVGGPSARWPMTDLAGKFLPAGIRQTIRPGEKSAAGVQFLLFSSTKMQLRQLNSGWRVPLRLVPEVADAGKEHRHPEPGCRGDPFARPKPAPPP